MEKYITEQAVERVKYMEGLFDYLQKTLKEKGTAVYGDNQFIQRLDILTDYYDNGLWQKDYHMDEEGLLPNGLKRGVLSEDGVYNFLSELKESEIL